MKKIFTTLALIVFALVAFATDGIFSDEGGGVITKQKVKKTAFSHVVESWHVPYRLTPGTLPHTVRKVHNAAANGLTANFSVQDGSSQQSVWAENFDATNSLSAWTIDQGEGNQITFELKNASTSFSTIDEHNVTSLHIEGGYSMPRRTKGYATSGQITIPANSQLHAYVSMSSNMSNYASLVIQISDDDFETASDLWTSADVTTSGRQWVAVDCDLSAFAGKTVKLRLYYGPGKGDSVGGSLADFYVDGMTVTGVNSIDQITVKTGERIQFVDLSIGTPTSWLWSFPGGTPTTSTEQNPEVYYEQPGTYDVTLKVKDSEGEDEVTKTAFVNVEGQSPIAGVIWPSEFRDYNTRMRMVAPLAPVTYKDNSQLYPTSYMWTMMSEYEVSGSTIIPKIYYDKDVEYIHEKLNKYYVTHIVQNETGYDFVDDSVQVQFAGLVTNFQKGDTYHTNFVDGEITLPGANTMLFVGMGTEVFVFFISAFDRPFDKTADGRDIPTHMTEEYLASGQFSYTREEQKAAAEETATYEPAQASATAQSQSAGTVAPQSAPLYAASSQPMAQPQVTAQPQPNFVPQMSEEEAKALNEAQGNYVEELKALVETLKKVNEQSERLTRDSEEMENLNRTLTGISKVYEMQLKGASQQIGTIDQINDQTRKMAQQIEQLNQIYARMIQAMTVNMKAAAPLQQEQQ